MRLFCKRITELLTHCRFCKVLALEVSCTDSVSANTAWQAHCCCCSTFLANLLFTLSFFHLDSFVDKQKSRVHCTAVSNEKVKLAIERIITKQHIGRHLVVVVVTLTEWMWWCLCVCVPVHALVDCHQLSQTRLFLAERPLLLLQRRHRPIPNDNGLFFWRGVSAPLYATLSIGVVWLPLGCKRRLQHCVFVCTPVLSSPVQWKKCRCLLVAAVLLMRMLMLSLTSYSVTHSYA